MDKNEEYFKDNKEFLKTKFKNKYVIVKDCKIVGAFDDEEIAYAKALDKYDIGDFYIDICDDSLPLKNEESASDISFTLLISGGFLVGAVIIQNLYSFMSALLLYLASALLFVNWVIKQMKKQKARNDNLQKQIEELKNKK
ncbi:MAG: hypothetical protein M0R05_06130 [Bacilli bacterium]|nr:hypothetical protein [Bacilli bacterium]MDD4388631.1 hypothetical protein [Bacilli bacterium]